MQTLVSILSGIALLVWGTHIVRSGLLRVLGGSLRRVLAGSVANPFTAFLAGLGVTGLVQSSSATALLAGSFVGQNLMALAPALAIMLGADVGTSLVVQVFSLDLSWLSPLLIGFGVLFHLMRKATREGQIGSEELAETLGPLMHYCIDKFGPNRCMFESNFPMDKVSYAYGVVWNAFKRLSKDYSSSERAALFHDTAVRVYGIVH